MTTARPIKVDFFISGIKDPVSALDDMSLIFFKDSVIVGRDPAMRVEPEDEGSEVGTLGLEAVATFIIESLDMLVPVIVDVINALGNALKTPVVTIDVKVGDAYLILSGPYEQVNNLYTQFLGAVRAQSGVAVNSVRVADAPVLS